MGLRQNFRDLPELLSASLGGVKAIAALGAEKYLSLLRLTRMLTVVLIALSFILFAGSELLDLSVLNVAGFLILLVVIFCWAIVAWPIYAIASWATSVEFEPVRRFVHWFNSFLVLVLTVVVVGFMAPSGTLGIQVIAIAVLFNVVFFLVGVKLGRGAFAVLLLFLALSAAFSLALPRTVEGFSGFLEAFDRDFDASLDDRQELTMSLPVLRRETEVKIPLFSRKGGRPNWWCRDDHSVPSRFKCYNREGRDPSTNEQLRPISTEIVKSAIANLEAARGADEAAAAQRDAAAVREAEENRRRAEDEELEQRLRSEAEAANLREQRRVSYSRQYLNLPNRPVSLAVMIANGQRFDPDLQSALRRRLGASEFDAFKSASLTDGVYTRVMQGEPSGVAAPEFV